MLLIFVAHLTPRVDYVFKHITTRILGLSLKFTTSLEEFVSHDGPKMSYGKRPLGSEYFVQAHDLLFVQGIEDIEVQVRPWEDTFGLFPTPERGQLPFDIFAGGFYLLSRYEEYLPHVKDELGRYPFTESLAFKHHFLESPLVDQWAIKFAQSLQLTFPELVFPRRQFKVHSVVEAKRPYEFLHRGLIRSVIGILGDFYKLRIGRIILRFQVLIGQRKDPYDTFNWILNNAKGSLSKVTVFFMLGEGYSFREDFNAKQERFRELIKTTADYVEVGLVLSYHWMMNQDQIKEEKHQIEDLTHRILSATFNDRQMVQLPHVYRSLVELEVASDYTMYYYNKLGFRAGTCTPFLFYDLDFEVKTPLVLQPLVGKSLALNLGKATDVEGPFMGLFDTVKSVQGTFMFMFSNRDFEPIKDNKIWRYLFSDKLMLRER